MQAVFAALDALGEDRLGVAVSGGGDSMALMALAADWAAARGASVSIVTVDHGLRAESAAEAGMVARAAASMGLPHETLAWGGWDGQGNLQMAAREARFALIGAWAQRLGLRCVLTGHTLDDQAETVLMRLARGSGVDGLSAIPAQMTRDGLRWMRPLLDQPRAALREVCTARGLAWVEDPTNEDPVFDRPRLRAAAPALAALGLTPERLAETARSMARARVALEAATVELSARVARVTPVGLVEIDRKGFAAAPEELRLRLLSAFLGWIGGAVYRPRLSALSAADAAACGQGALRRTLSGVVMTGEGAHLTLTREVARIGPDATPGACWDGRWQTRGPAHLRVAPLGAAGLASLANWRDLGHPRAALLASPAFWQNDALVASPFALPREDCHAWLNTQVDTVAAASALR